MRLLQRLAGKSFTDPPFWAQQQFMDWAPYSSSDREQIDNNFAGYVQQAYKSNGIVFACMLARQLLFSEARFQWRRFQNGRPTDLFGDASLAVLEQPWTNGTTGELLTRMEQDASLAGNFYATTVDAQGRLGRRAAGDLRIRRMRPDWVTIIVHSPSGNPFALDAVPAAYWYRPATGLGSDVDTLLAADEVCHYSPVPDPLAQFRGMSWLTPTVREVMADTAATKHKLKFFERGATLQTVATLPKEILPDDFDAFVSRFRAQHEGVDNAYKTLFLGGGADVTLVGAGLDKLGYSAVQGAGEVRIAAAARVPAVIAGLSEGLQGSSLNTGNFTAAKRLFADGFARPHWRMAAASLQSLVAPPTGAQLWYDDRDIPFLRDDIDAVAATQFQEAQTIRQLVDAGYEPASINDAMRAGDWSRLVHTGLYSVQLQKPGSGSEPPSGGTA